MDVELQTTPPLTRRGIPKTNRTVTADRSGCNRPAVGRERNRPDPIAVPQPRCANASDCAWRQWIAVLINGGDRCSNAYLAKLVVP
jgi:hypothetical protein